MDNIQNLKMQNARLKALNMQYEETIRRLTEQVKTYEAKEQNISSAIEFAVERSNQLDSSMKKLYELEIHRSRLLYAKMERVLDELYAKYPALKKETQLKSVADKFKIMATAKDESRIQMIGPNVIRGEDPIRKLLNNLIGYIDSGSNTKVVRSRGKVLSAMDCVYNSYASTPSKSGFDINEALNPTENLEEILKSFDLNRKAK